MRRVETRPSTRLSAVDLKADGGWRKGEDGRRGVCQWPFARRSSRRGVLLLVVLSMLVLFMLIGTAFLMTSSHSRDAAKGSAKKDRVGNHATRLLDRALLQLLRDTENPHSVVRTHSLLRDLYGVDGFEARVLGLRNTDPLYAAQFAGASLPGSPSPLGHTQGQFIDIFVRPLSWSPTKENDPATPENESLLTTPDARHVVRLERDVTGTPVVHRLPLAKGYYNGCLLTMTSGPAQGQSTRIVDYEAQVINNVPIYRFRVMAFSRADGTPLQLRGAAERLPNLEIRDLVDDATGLGHSFIVNGRAFSGTGVGYNALADPGVPSQRPPQPRLSAVELFLTAPDAALGAELALLPNAAYFNPRTSLVASPPPNLSDPFRMPTPLTGFARLNDPSAALFTYGGYSGPGDANESYDAADFQNMFLASLTVTPRSQGRVVQGDAANPVTLNVADPALDRTQFLRLDLEDLPWPSFHRPDLVNFWYHRLVNLLTTSGMNADDAVRAVMQPYDANGNVNPAAAGLTPQQATLITAIKRKIMLRPIREDHPNFDGGNPQSIPPNLAGVSNLTKGGNIAIPYWEAVGPWDVDNDNDGVPDSVWVDLGDPVQQLEDGTRYKTLYAILCIDLDGRLNLNAHGLADHINPVNLDPSGGRGNLAHDPNDPNPALRNIGTNILAQGVGYGPAEISLRPVMPAPWSGVNSVGQPTGFVPGNRNESVGPIDSYATLLAGRTRIDDTAILGKYGYVQNMTFQQRVTADTNYDYAMYRDDMRPTGDRAFPSLAAQLKFFTYPWNVMHPTAFGTWPDLFGRYAIGLDYGGQPFYEAKYDRNPATPTTQWWWNHLLAKSPYELDLSSPQRRDTSSVTFATPADAWSRSVDLSYLGGPAGLNDDAPFATADLERVLRAWDADAGTLPSRVWDVVDVFDPEKLLSFDPFRVRGVASTAFGVPNPRQPELVAAAQQIAAINRRLVTTDQFDLPVPGQAIPEWVRISAENLRVASNGALGATAEDVFANVTGKPLSRATIFDLLMFRVQKTRYAQTGSLYDLTNAQQRVVVNSIVQQLLAPEVIAGKRMDINRPFGDGQDSNGNGVVDDPLEAGEPFLDVNGNGKWDNGEPFLDVLPGDTNGDGSPYDGPTDRLWAQLWPAPVGNNTLAEPITFDHTNGQANPIRAEQYNQPVAGGVRNLESHARQLYARHLYCLMLLLVDEDYIAPWDENDPQTKEYLDTSASHNRDLVAAVGAQQAARILARKLTCRKIAQWAVNCVDASDADVIMTPFEYDENPWDGWGCLDANGLNIPLDGDTSTDENKGEVIDWNQAPQKVKSTVAVPPPLNQTRGVIWGAERPELLITETLAFHDRRTEDLGSDFTKKQMRATNSPPDDDDLDQRLRPKGSLFVELYNPWSADGQYPAELYTKLDATTNYNAVASPFGQGVELGRLSNLADSSGRRSPVWRLIVVEEHPTYRNDDRVDDTGSSIHTGPAPTYYRGPYVAADPDHPLFKHEVRDNWPYIERSIYFTTDNSDRYRKGETLPNHDDGVNSLALLVKNPETKLRLPPQIARKSARYFIAGDVRNLAGGAGAEDQDVPIAPLLPGRYAVVGTAGTQYTGREERRVAGQRELAPRYVLTISRRFYEGTDGRYQTPDATHVGALESTRRIELLPSPNPNVQQILVAANGGAPVFPITSPFLRRDNEVAKVQQGPMHGEFRNIYAGGSNPDGLLVPDSVLIPPCVAIPVAHMSVSEPLDLYKARRDELQAEERSRQPQQGESFTQLDHYWDPFAAEGEGQFTLNSGGGGTEAPYDTPFDTAPELKRNGTTRNYRTLHLQRLADPTLPWNPPPGQYKDASGADMHMPNLPVNPYRTIDSSSVDLTAFNGTSRREADMDNQVVNNEAKWLPDAPLDATQQPRFRYEFGPFIQGNPQNPVHRLHFKSLERGAHDNDPTMAQVSLPRTLWQQEPVNRYHPTDRTRNDMLEWMTIPNQGGTARRQAELQKRAHDLRIRDVQGLPGEGKGELIKDIEAIAAGLDGDFTQFPDGLKPKPAQFDIVMDHSLGFQNESFGALAAQTDLAAANLPLTAWGKPMPDRPDFTRMLPVPNTNVLSTFPWLAWNNRPFVSAAEILNVPSASSAQLLRRYTGINTAETTDVNKNPYLNDGLNGDRNNVYRENLPFGHLLNFFAAFTQRQFNNTPLSPPHFYRILEYVQVPSRFVGTETLFNAETFNDVPGVVDAVGGDIAGPADPRYHFQPPFNKISRERDPGRVNLNTVTGRRQYDPTLGFARHWSEVFDGIMHRVRDGNWTQPAQLGHLGPSWRDVVLSRKGYAQFNAGFSTPIEKSPDQPPDVFACGLNPYFPSVISNPFRSPAAGDLVPLPQMMHFGVDASWLRGHHYNRGPGAWGRPGDDNNDGSVDDAREAGFGGDILFADTTNGALLPPNSPNPAARGIYPLFSETFDAPYFNGERNSSLYYQPLTRLGNLVTMRSNVYAIWITVGYFEVEPAPSWSDPNVRARFGGTMNDNDPVTQAALALYNRVYPDGYMLGREIGSDTGNIRRPRGFYIVDRTEAVGFKPGEDINVERMIRLRRRIE